MNRAEQRREGVSILNTGSGDLAFDRQAKRFDGDMPFAALDFLAGVEAAWAARCRRLDRLAITTTTVGAGSRPSASRAANTSTPIICGHSPLSRHA
jgi:hypothetical protein